jgi:tetratricopeptide (TPR) repeat protein
MNTSTFNFGRRGFSIRYYILITIVITLCSQTACTSKAVGETPLPAPETADHSDEIALAESLFLQREDPSKLESALSLLSSARDPSSRDFEIEWRFAKFNYFLGKQQKDEKQRTEAFESGREAALIASRMRPDRPDGHFWYAANLGELSQISPITVGIRSIGDIRGSMTRVIEIEPAYEFASAYDALGQLELKSRMYGGKAENAVAILEKGVEINPLNPNIRVHLAEAYLAVKRDQDAKKQIDELLKLDADPKYRREHGEAVAKARKLLETRF